MTTDHAIVYDTDAEDVSDAQKKAKKKITVDATIVKEGDQMILPKGMTLLAAHDLIKRRIRYEEQTVRLHEEFDVFPYDGAHALFQVFRELFGWVENIAVPTMFGPEPPVMLNIQVGYNKNTTIPWGRYGLPGGKLEGFLETGGTKKEGRFIFVIGGEIKRRDEVAVQMIFDRVRDYLKTGSIYQGKAVGLKFFDSDGDALPMPVPEFLDTEVDENGLAFPKETTDAVTTNLFTPLTRLKDLKKNGIPIKRGVLLGGPYGTGKTLTAKIAAKLATQNGITYLYARQANELAHVIQFAKQYAEPAVVIFCEDIDSVVKSKRTQTVNDVLNLIDGVDTKSLNLITLLTTNHVEQIGAAMLRPGRLDAVITIPAPDAETVQRLLYIYGGDIIPPNADLTALGEELSGAIPAIIAEVVKRAKLHQLALQKPGTRIKELSVEALMQSAKTMRAQRTLLDEQSEAQKDQGAISKGEKARAE